MDLLHLSFVGGLKAHQAPPVPPTAAERLNAFRAAWQAPGANTYPWRWLDDPAREARSRPAGVSSLEAARARRQTGTGGKTTPAAA